MSERLFVLEEKQLLARWEEVPRPATPEEIKAAHPQCGTCKHYDDRSERGILMCECYHNGNNWMPTDYCNHHEVKEQP